MTPRTPTVACLRVSTDKQADHGVSLEAQEAKVRAYADLFELDLVAVEIDAGESAKSLDRPALDRALGMLRSGKAKAILVVKLSTRTLEHGLWHACRPCDVWRLRRWWRLAWNQQVARMVAA